MFNPQKKGGTGLSKRDNIKDFAVTIITNGCHFSGKLYCKGSTRIGGKVEGEIISEGLLIVEEGAIINADARVEDIVVQGNFRGTVEATGKVELSTSCVFEGDIITTSLVILEGAQFNGRTTMDTSRMVERQRQDISERAPYLSSALGNDDELKSVNISARVPEISADL